MGHDDWRRWLPENAEPVGYKPPFYTQDIARMRVVLVEVGKITL